MRFSKYHALGNDYLVLTPEDCPQLFNPQEIVAVCHRNFGLGSDGILYGPLKTDQADFGLQIWNPDGSEAEKSGNGLRIFARYLHDTGLVSKAPFTVETLGGVVSCRVHRPDFIEVEMGQVSFDAAQVPVIGLEGEVLNQNIELDGDSYRYNAATIGNPHVVVPLESVTPALACRLGPLLENDTSRFPNRTNVQLLEVMDEHRIRIEIWERGAGYTLASGSSSSAAAAVAVRLGLCQSPVTVQCPGGEIGISVSPDFHITMSGPATRVGIFEMDPAVPSQDIPEG